MIKSLTVWWDGARVGLLRIDDNGDLEFVYDPDWVGDPARPAVSISLPKRLESFNRRETRPFVAGLLPEEAQRDAVAEIRSWLGQHSVTRVGPRGKQEVVPIEQLETVAVSHKTSRAGDPHRHIHFQIGMRVVKSWGVVYRWSCDSSCCGQAVRARRSGSITSSVTGSPTRRAAVRASRPR